MYVYARIGMYVPVFMHVNNVLYSIYSILQYIYIYNFNHVKNIDLLKFSENLFLKIVFI